MTTHEERSAGIKSIRSEGPVSTTLHNLVQTLSVKLDSAARYELYEQDARREALGPDVWDEVSLAWVPGAPRLRD